MVLRGRRRFRELISARQLLVEGDQYFRYSTARYDTVDHTLPRDFQHRWSDAADYRLSDVHTITRFDLDPLAPLGLKNDGRCEFALTASGGTAR